MIRDSLLHVAIVEDDPLFSNKIKEYLERFSSETGRIIRYEHFEDGKAFIDGRPDEFELILFDIEMPRMDRMEAASQIRKTNSSAIIIFITSLAQYAYKGYEVEALDYMVKPITYATFSLRMQKVLLKTKCSDTRLKIGGITKQRFVPVRDIYYIESLGHNLTYHTKEGVFSENTRQSLKKLESTLADYGFAKVSGSVIVSLRYVKRIKGNIVEMPDGTVEITRTMKDSFLSELLRFEEL